MNIHIQLVKAFTKDVAAGNPAGVVHEANALNDNQMLEIAQVLGFSESAFVQGSNKADFRVRFFTAKEEVDFCGHATIATFHSLVEQGIISLGNSDMVKVTQETGIGVLNVTCHQNGKIMMSQNNPEFNAIDDDKAMIAKLLGLGVADLSELPIQAVSTGVPKLIVPVSSLASMRKIVPNLKAISSYCKQNPVKGFSVFTTEVIGPSSDIATRYFNPLVGIDEDSATGIAAGPLGCYADKYVFNGEKKKLVIEQGFDMGKKSTIYVDISNGVLVGGYGASFGTQDIDV